MKKYLSIFLCFTIIMGLFGCGKTENTTVEIPEVNNVEFDYSFVAKSENGYYFWEPLTVEIGFSRLMFMDATTQKMIPLCNKADCEHNTKECNSYYPEIGEDEYGLDKRYVQYYNGSLYAIGCDESDYVSLYRIKADGTEWEKAIQLYKTTNSVASGWITPYTLIANNCVYYVDVNQMNEQLCFKSLNGDGEKVIFSGEEYNSCDVYRLKVYGEYLYFQVMCYKDDTMESWDGGLYRCDKNGNLELVKEGLIVPYTVCGDEVYYTKERAIGCYSMKNKSEKSFETEIEGLVMISSTSEYIIAEDDEHFITYFYDRKGKLRHSVSGKDKKISYFGGDASFRFGRGTNGEGVSDWCIIEMDELDNGASWKGL